MEDYRVIKKCGQGGQGTTLQVCRDACEKMMDVIEHSLPLYLCVCQVQRKVDGLGFVCKQVVCENIGSANFALKEAKTLQRLEHVG
jgi:hypothetical protein